MKNERDEQKIKEIDSIVVLMINRNFKSQIVRVFEKVKRTFFDHIVINNAPKLSTWVSRFTCEMSIRRCKMGY